MTTTTSWYVIVALWWFVPIKFNSNSPRLFLWRAQATRDENNDDDDDEGGSRWRAR